MLATKIFKQYGFAIVAAMMTISTELINTLLMQKENYR